MKTLLDEHLDIRAKAMLKNLEVHTVREMGWLGSKNGELRDKMDSNGFQALITADKNMPFQQNLAKLKFVIVLIDTPNLDVEYQKQFFPKIQQFLANPPERLPKIVHIAVEGITKGNRLESLQELLPPEDILSL